MPATQKDIALYEMKTKPFSLQALILACITTMGLFCALPFINKLNKPAEDHLSIQTQAIQQPPPPEESITDSNDFFNTPSLSTPSLSTQLPQAEFSPLAVVLDATTIDNQLMGLAPDATSLQIDTFKQIEKVFAFSELSTAPSVLHVPTMTYPKQLIRKGIRKGTVILLIQINKEGRVKVEQILHSTHSSLNALALKTAEQSRFSISKKDGKAVNVRGKWPLTIEAP